MKILLGSILLSLSLNANAAALWCTGNLNAVWINSAGNVMVLPSFRRSHIKLCNVNTASGGVSVDVCKSWLSTAQLAYASREKVVSYYPVPGTSSCSQLAVYAASPAPGYFMIQRYTTDDSFEAGFELYE